MFKLLFDIILNLVATLVQAIMIPFNLLINQFLPNFSNKVIEVSQTLGTLFNGITWGLGLIPTPIIYALTFMVSIEIAKILIYTGSHNLTKLWTLIQKLKFW